MDRIKHIVEFNILLGAWLIVAPFVMGYSATTVEVANDVGLGVWLIGCSWWMLAAVSGRVGAGTLELIGGLWLVAAPFVLHYQRMSRPFDNDIAVGILAVTASVTAMWMLSSKLRTADGSHQRLNMN